MKQSVFVIRNMDCRTEEALIRKRLGSVAGVSALAFNLMGRRLTVNHTLADEQPILGALRDVGMEATSALPDVAQSNCDGTCAAVTVVEETPEESAELRAAPLVSRRTWLMMAISGVAALAAEVLAWTGFDETSPTVIVLALLSIAAGGLGTLRKGWIALKTFTLNINFLMSVAVIGAVAIGEWPEAAVVIFLLRPGRVKFPMPPDRALPFRAPHSASRPCPFQS